MTYGLRRKIIELRFGEYGGQYTHWVRKGIDVARQLGIDANKVSYTCKVYQKNGGFLMAHPRKMNQKRGPVKMTKEIIDHVINPKTLREWAHLTLVERCKLIEEKFGVKMCG